MWWLLLYPTDVAVAIASGFPSHLFSSFIRSVLLASSSICFVVSFIFPHFVGSRFSWILIVSAVTGVQLSFSLVWLRWKFNHYTKYTDVIIPKMICSKLYPKRKVSYIWNCGNASYRLRSYYNVWLRFYSCWIEARKRKRVMEKESEREKKRERESDREREW